MEPWHWGVLLRPLLAFVAFALVIIPLGWVVLRFVPEGRLKRLLSRDMTRPEASERDKIIATLMIVGALAAVVVYAGLSR